MESKPKIQAITFDAAGTLINPHPSVGAIYCEVLQQFGVEAIPAEVEARFYKAFKQAKQQPGFQLDKAGWRVIVELTFAGYSIKDWDALFDALWETFALPNRWQILPGVLPVLEKLQAADMRMAVLSNNDSRLHRVLEGLELARYFEQIFVSSEMECEKPALEIFRQVEHALKLEPQSLLHVGDSEREDISGAVNAGWPACLVGAEGLSLEASFLQDGTIF